MESLTPNTQNRRVLRWSIVSSAAMNVFLFSAALVGPHTLYRRIADAIAAPTGIVANRFFAPREHSASQFIIAALLSLAFSFLLYGIVSWIVVQGFLRLRSLRRHTEYLRYRMNDNAFPRIPGEKPHMRTFAFHY